MKLFIEQHQDKCKICIDTDEAIERENAIKIALERAKEIQKSINVRTDYHYNDSKFYRYHVEVDVSGLASHDIYNLIDNLERIRI